VAAKTIYLISSTRLSAMALTIFVRWVVSDAEKLQITFHISVSKLHIDMNEQGESYANAISGLIAHQGKHCPP
jgi:hypothetical protein